MTDINNTTPPMATTVELPRTQSFTKPTSPSERVLSLDVLRGVAIFGIFVVNIAYMSNTLMSAEMIDRTGVPFIDVMARQAVDFFAVFKFITLFSLLFGMGLAMQSDKADEKNASFVEVYVRRMAILMMFGILHGTLLWYGDILFMYAVLGLIAIPCRRWSNKTLLISAAILFLIPIVFFALGTLLEDAFGDFSTSQMQSTIAVTAEMDSENSAAKLKDDPFPGLEQYFGNERDVYSNGPFGKIVQLRTVHFVLISIFANFLLFSWRCMAMYFCGMALHRSGIMQDPRSRLSTVHKFVVIGLAVGVPIQLAGMIYYETTEFTIYTKLLRDLCLYVGSIGISAAYLGIVLYVCVYAGKSRIVRAFSAVGKMALTNYLSHSLICGLIFYSYGLGYFGQVSYSGVLLIALSVFLLQLVVSPIWLRYFAFGPVEWIWRTLTYLKMP